MEWFSQTVAIILLVSSIISPIIVTLINNRQQNKIKKIDIYEDAKRKALSEFIDCSNHFLQNKEYIDLRVKYYSSLNKLFIYFKNINLTTFMQFEILVDKSETRKAILELSNIVHELSKQVHKE